MDREEIVKIFCESRIGCPYIYGATGRQCTPDYRRARMAQYPAFAQAIAENCPRLKSNRTSCVGCKWAKDGKGLPAYDCAQFTRRALETAGISLPSGATSQYNADVWEAKGTFTGLPPEPEIMCVIWRKGAYGMDHVGMYMGDGTVIHASSHHSGVIRTRVSDGKWTHYGIPRGLYGSTKESGMELYEVTGKQLALRDKPGTSGAVLTRIATGALVQAQDCGTVGWLEVQHSGMTGFCMAQYLKKVSDNTTAPEKQESEEGGVLYKLLMEVQAALDRAKAAAKEV